MNIHTQCEVEGTRVCKLNPQMFCYYLMRAFNDIVVVANVQRMLFLLNGFKVLPNINLFIMEA